jgi:serine/threonine-protein kinase
VALLIAGAATAAYFLSRPQQRRVPTVTGEQLNTARTVLQDSGFSVDVIRVASRRTAGIVIGENPGAGTGADKGSTVTLTVSQGPGNRSVPSVQGLSEDTARKHLQSAKLKVRVVTQSSTRFPSGQATGTDPRAGASVSPGTDVTLFISSGPPQKTVPSVVGESQNAATTALQNAGFKVSSSTQDSSTVKAGNVISQSPGGNTSADPGSTVSIVVASAPPTGTVPPVVGDPVGSATSALLAAGFKVTRQTRDVRNPNQDGNVIDQSPSGGSTARKNTTVTIVVGHFVQSSSSTTTTTSSTTTSTSSTTSSSTTPAKP